MTERLDIHRSTEIVPADYVWVGVFYQGGSEWELDGYRFDNRRRAEFLMNAASRDQQAFRGNHDEKGSCDICGTFFAHGAYWLHKPTGDIIHTGQDCAAKLDLAASGEMATRRGAIKAQVADAKRRAEIAAAREAFLAERPGLAEALECEHGLVRDIADKFRRYGDLSDRQVEVVIKIARESVEKAKVMAAAAEVVAAPAVIGKAVEIVGVVKSVKWTNGQFPRLAMTVLDDRGFRVWGTVPKGLELREGQWGKRVRFVADTASADDETFAWFKRPRAAELLDTELVAA